MRTKTSLSNQKGYSLMSMMVSMGVTLIVMNGLSQLMIQKSQAIQRFKVKANDVQGQIGFTRYLSDVSSCSCLLDSQNAANPIRASLSVSVATVKSKQASNSTGPTITLPRLLMVPNNGGACDYGSAKVFAEPDGYIPGSSSGATIDEITIDDIQLIGDSAGGPVGGFYHMKGLLTIAPNVPATTTLPIRPLRQEIVFYTDAGGSIVSCDSSESMREVFNEKSDNFKQTVEQQSNEIVQEYVNTVTDTTTRNISTVETTVTNRYETTLRQGINELNQLLQ